MQRGCIVYPYEYFDKFERFNETKLPEKEKYYSTLSKRDITDEEYEFAKEVWEKFKLKNLGELHDLYMNTDVMILADVFESSRDTALKKYKFPWATEEPKHAVWHAYSTNLGKYGETCEAEGLCFIPLPVDYWSLS